MATTRGFWAGLSAGMGVPALVAVTMYALPDAHAGDRYCEVSRDRIELSGAAAAGLRGALDQALGGMVPTVFTRAICVAGEQPACTVEGWQRMDSPEALARCQGRPQVEVPANWQGLDFAALQAAAAAYRSDGGAP